MIMCDTIKETETSVVGGDILVSDSNLWSIL